MLMMKDTRVLFSAVLLVACVLFAGGMAYSEEKTSIGVAEEVILLPWQVRIPARIDTGALMTSLDARELTVTDGVAEFRLPEKYGGTKISLPVVEWKKVRSASGTQRRPVVEMEVCVGSRALLAKVNLSNRAKMKYPMIVGRNILEQGFVVDCLCANILKPTCPRTQIK